VCDGLDVDFGELATQPTDQLIATLGIQLRISMQNKPHTHHRIMVRRIMVRPLGVHHLPGPRVGREDASADRYQRRTRTKS
jgi:hypothetical protein